MNNSTVATAPTHTVGEVARIAHVSVRTLHHYDEVGLLRPQGRSPSGYRRYSDADLERLRRILYYRALGFGLDDIAGLLADPQASGDDHLRRQHRLVRDQIAQRHAVLAALEKEMEARDMGISLTSDEQFEIFGTDAVGDDWAEEAEQRWGDTAAWQQSQRRTSAYTKQDWMQIKAESDANIAAFAAAIRDGLPADGPRARELAEEHRQHISRWFYDCGYALHRGLAELYISDERFSHNYDGVVAGMAQYVHDAIVANADLCAGS